LPQLHNTRLYLSPTYLDVQRIGYWSKTSNVPTYTCEKHCEGQSLAPELSTLACSAG